ncbi:MAG: hypothetical protein HS115_09735 [Spirochaetales bacterium]|nr:hypothetical protein [Spirochaetales bacterium]
MSCQRENASCSACCGLYNLKLSREARQALLAGRSARFVLRPDTWYEFRKEREAEEQSIERFVSDVYVCPFVGFIAANRTGCLIHPERTGLADSQNFSFYGASICQAYDCYPKENDSGWWSRFLEREFPDQYGQLMGDTLFYRALIRMGAGDDDWTELRSLCQLRLQRQQGVHSFEIDFQPLLEPEEILVGLCGEEAKIPLQGLVQRKGRSWR